MFKSKILLHVCDTDNCDYLPHITFCFYLIDFQLNTNFPFKCPAFTVKSPHVTQRLVSQKIFLKRVKTRRLFAQQ